MDTTDTLRRNSLEQQALRQTSLNEDFTTTFKVIETFRAALDRAEEELAVTMAGDPYALQDVAVMLALKELNLAMTGLQPTVTSLIYKRFNS